MTIDLSEHFPHLTPRERQVCALMVIGKSSKEIGQEIGISHRTIEDHKNSIFRKLKVETAIQATYIALGSPQVTA